MFLVFGGERYYAAGGGFDLLGRSEDRGEAIAFAQQAIGWEMIYADRDFPDDDLFEQRTPIEWAHVLDAETGVIVAKFGERPHGQGRMCDEMQR